ncbi:hypothetical protein [Alteromonas lipolytica]|uniref:Uncharacterized protein n=1 Tax=Alteromonas lipolytica TaxID=1856405 RepID=A0A1E8FHL7_9ALTE|nr:hypothetical protein [Alteromonas lipolytica]OFI35430.1 hypothetical protein BFC17_11720 [Alteromonas lipolytica]GGF76191.1 hypothetical protein GCM10011338_30450 [Alteromonas lipolytica]
MTAKIKLTNSAFFSLLLEGLEAYAIKHQGKRDVAIETHAQLWGSSNKRLPFSCEIKHVSVDSSAKKKRGEVTVKQLALDLKQDVAAMFGDGYAHLGTFHTHPWVLKNPDHNVDENKAQCAESPSYIRRHKLYDFSEADHFCECNSPTIKVGKHEFSIALVMTIFAGKKADDRKDGPVDDSLFEFSLGNVKVWLKAQVYQHKPESSLSDDEHEQLNIYGLTDYSSYQKQKFNSVPVPVSTMLETPFLEKISYYLEEFGRLSIKGNKSIYRTAEEAEKRWFAI